MCLLSLTLDTIRWTYLIEMYFSHTTSHKTYIVWLFILNSDSTEMDLPK